MKSRPGAIETRFGCDSTPEAKAGSPRCDFNKRDPIATRMIRPNGYSARRLPRSAGEHQYRSITNAELNQR